MEQLRVVREDGRRGMVVDRVNAASEQHLTVAFDDGSRLVVPESVLVRRDDGSYLLPLGSSGTSELVEGGEIVVPVVAEELRIEKRLRQRSKVRVNKRVEHETRVVDEPLLQEHVEIERVAVNQLVEGEPPTARNENGRLIIPILEEVLVVEKRLMVREEVHLIRQRSTISRPQEVVVRREVVDVERIPLDADATLLNQHPTISHISHDGTGERAIGDHSSAA